VFVAIDEHGQRRGELNGSMSLTLSSIGRQIAWPRSITQRVSSGQSALVVHAQPTVAFGVAFVCAIEGSCGGGELGAFRLHAPTPRTTTRATAYRMVRFYSIPCDDYAGVTA
jgi:hypothetical protein